MTNEDRGAWSVAKKVKPDYPTNHYVSFVLYFQNLTRTRTRILQNTSMNPRKWFKMFDDIEYQQKPPYLQEHRIFGRARYALCMKWNSCDSHRNFKEAPTLATTQNFWFMQAMFFVHEMRPVWLSLLCFSMSHAWFSRYQISVK